MMAESKAEPSTISVTTAPSYNTAPKSGVGISLNMGYFRTGPGIVKLVQLFIAILCMACAAPAWTNGTHWFLFVVVTAFVATSLWCFIYLLSLREAINLPIDWLLTELLNTSLTTILYLIAVIVQFCSIERSAGRNITAGVFGVFNMLAYTLGSFFLYRDWKDSHPNSSFSGSVLKRNP
ncbi:uncharacterized protein LOC108671276 isoform X2 [Hyalella azteca]|uniref:Uncharacterized protein LOC108671276 isoform X2 n=1 Tax=Hyalella azteca TaxID=294128 RepID=A0A8B7NKU0_HYAAZ|nr:uncharacterized protein LOC108671276 isoform X2 [Hyalella azteca]